VCKMSFLAHAKLFRVCNKLHTQPFINIQAERIRNVCIIPKK